MLNIAKSFLALFVATTILTMGGGLLNSLLSINMRLQGSSDQVIGLVMSCYYLGFVLGIYFCQPIVQYVGHIRSFAVFAALLTTICLLYGLYSTAWFWAVLRICHGLCSTGLFTVIESWLNEKVEPAFRGRLLSVYMVLVYLGIGSGQQLLNLSDVQGKGIFMVAAMMFALCLIPISITRAVNPKPLKVPRYNLIKLFKLAPISMVGSFAAGLIGSAFYAMAPVIGLDIGMQVSQVSWFMSITVWSGLIFQFPVGFLSDRFDRLRVLSVLGFLVVVISLAMALTGVWYPNWLIILTACFGIVFSIYPVSLARAQDNIDAEDIVSVSAALILFFGIGATFGPLAVSLVISQVGPWGLYLHTGFCGGVLGVAAWIQGRKLPSDIDTQVEYVPVPRTSPVVSTLDPRAEPDGQA